MCRVTGTSHRALEHLNRVGNKKYKYVMHIGILVRAHFGQSNFPFSQQKRKKEILLILIIFAYFKVQKKIERKKMVSKIDHLFIFLLLKLNSKIQKIL